MACDTLTIKILRSFFIELLAAISPFSSHAIKRELHEFQANAHDYVAIIILWQVGYRIASLMYNSLFRKAVDKPSDTGYVPTVLPIKH